MPDPLRLTSLQIREIAEYAESVRGIGGDDVYFVAQLDDASNAVTITCEKELPAPSPLRVVIPASTASVQPLRDPVESVTILAKGMKQPDSLDDYDAVFWSESAVEKFLFPYYASKSQWEAAHVLAALAKVFYGFVPGGPAAGGAASDPIPFAVAHLPRSDYVPLEVPLDLPLAGRDVALLFRNADGSVSHRLLAEFL
ncbi:MAG: hypothetical protein JWM27_4527 [Gemmatimonadetes bacterium]|nr:hypothetical protein [Gemmatimonadota bacterium]